MNVFSMVHEPPSTDPYARWCERDKKGHLAFLTLLDLKITTGGAKFLR